MNSYQPGENSPGPATTAMQAVLGRMRMVPLSLRILLLVWLIWTILRVWLQFPYPFPDVFIFKQAGANLAQSGRFAAWDLPGMEQGGVHVYASYPPLYPFTYGLWSMVVGFGFRTSILYDCCLQLFRLIGMYWLLRAFLGGRLDQRQELLLTLAWLPFALATSIYDRPDEMATGFGLMSLALLIGGRGPGRLAAAGVLLGLSGVSAPMGGLVFAALITMAILSGEQGARWKHRVQSLAICGGVSAMVALIIFCPVLLYEPAALGTFLRHCGIAGKLGREAWGAMLTDGRGADFMRFLGHTATRKLSYLSSAILMGSLWVYRKRVFEDIPSQRVLVPALVLFSALVLYSYQFGQYFWYMAVLFGVIWAALLMRQQDRRRRAALVVCVWLILPWDLVFATGGLIDALTRPPEQSHSAAYERLKSLEISGRVIASPNHFYILQRLGTQATPFYYVEGPQDSDYMVFPKRGWARADQVSCPWWPADTAGQIAADYEVIDDSINRKPLTLLGVRLTGRNYGYGSLVLRRKRRVPQ